MDIVFVVLGLVVGAIAAWFVAKFKFMGQKGISTDELEDKYILKTIYQELKHDFELKGKELLETSNESARIRQDNIHLNERLSKQKEETEELQKTFRVEFQNLANQLLDEKSKRFVELNEQKVGEILKPLREKIQEFEKKIDDNLKDEIKERTSLKEELKRIAELNQQVSEDADRLAKALKGDSKTQGDWGELQLELILEKGGLTKGLHYNVQMNLKDEQGKNFRPDFVINLPEDKHIIVDSKVSLTAYEQYFNAEDEQEKAQYLKQHIDSISRHISDLSSKNYPTLYGINQPDYVLMFIPLEPAMMIAVKEEIRLFERALERNIVLVSTSTLLATLKTISYMWKQENQKQNVYEIAQESGKLYDKFVGFIEDLIGVGKKLDEAKITYSGAMNKLVESTKRGDTIVGRIERIKNLGANTTKTIPQSIINRIDEEPEAIE